MRTSVVNSSRVGMWLLYAVAFVVMQPHDARSQETPRQMLNREAREIGQRLFRDHIGPRIQDNIPLVASSGSFTFTFNRELEVWEREHNTSGPILLERAETLGRGKFDVNVSYGYLKFSEINGRSIDDELQKTRDNVTFTYRIRAAEAQLVNFTLTYGVTDEVDLSLVVPVERVFFSGRFVLTPPVLEPSAPARFDHFGVGDIELRGKWRALTSDYADVAAGLDLKVPSGDRDKGLGVGDTRLSPLVYASHTFFGDAVEPHVNLGVEINLAEARDSRLLYGGGVTYQLWGSTRQPKGRGLGLTLDLIGKADLQPPENRNRGSFFGTSRQRNLLDVAPGVKVAFSEHLLVYTAVEVPLTSDDIRTAFTPIGGVEALF
jgi:hypothetical protein